jgi:hypothetical protein
MPGNGSAGLVVGFIAKMGQKRRFFRLLKNSGQLSEGKLTDAFQ